VTGAISGAVGGGSRGAVSGAFGAAIFAGIGSQFHGLEKGPANSGFWGSRLTGSQFAAKVALHGLAGGVMNELGGGKFGHGFASAAGTQLDSAKIGTIGGGKSEYRAQRIFAAALVGGTIAEATGGKFANGAMTGAFSRAFNDEGNHEGEPIVNDKCAGCTLVAVKTDGRTHSWAWVSSADAADYHLAQDSGAVSLTSYRTPGLVANDFMARDPRTFGAVSYKLGFGIQGQFDVNVNSSGLSFYLGAGVGEGASRSVYYGEQAGDASGITGKLSMSGGFGGGGRASFTVSESGVQSKAGFGAVSGANFGATVGYTFKLSWIEK